MIKPLLRKIADIFNRIFFSIKIPPITGCTWPSNYIFQPMTGSAFGREMFGQVEFPSSNLPQLPLSAERRFRCPSHVVWGFCWNLDTCDRFPESPHRARHESSLGCGIPLRLHLQILLSLPWAALVLKMERVYNFFTNGIASIAQVGSKNQAQPTRPIACICDLTSFDRSQPTPKMPQTPNKISPPKWDNEPRSRPKNYVLLSIKPLSDILAAYLYRQIPSKEILIQVVKDKWNYKLSHFA